MNKLRKATILLAVVFPLAGFGMLGCGRAEPQPRQGDFDAAEIKAIEEASKARPRRRDRTVRAPKGEPTTVEGP